MLFSTWNRPPTKHSTRADICGDANKYGEPFAGSAAMLLGRPNVGKVETINDADGFVANF